MNAARVRIIILGVATLMLAVLYYLLNPTRYSFFPKCPFYVLTGLYCPGCGSQRAFHALLHGRLLQAAGYNLLAVLALPFLIYSGIVLVGNNFWKKHWHQHVFYKPWFARTVLGLVLVFWFLRNLPVACFHWMAP